MSNEFWYWTGRSGGHYVHTVYTEVPLLIGSLNYIFVRRNDDGSRDPLYIGETDDMRRRWREHVGAGLVQEAQGLGLNELHVHLLSKTAKEREQAETDLRHAHPTPLNRQGIPQMSELEKLAKALADSRLMTPNALAPTSTLAQTIANLLMTEPPSANAFTPTPGSTLARALMTRPVQPSMSDLVANLLDPYGLNRLMTGWSK